MAIQEYSVTDVLRERVKKVMFDSLPDEMIDEMLKKEYASFSEEHTSYGNTKPSEFSVIVAGELKERLTAKVKAWMDANFQEQWDEVGDLGGTLIAEAAAELAPLVQKAFVVDICARTVAQIKNNLPQY